MGIAKSECIARIDSDNPPHNTFPVGLLPVPDQCFRQLSTDPVVRAILLPGLFQGFFIAIEQHPKPLIASVCGFGPGCGEETFFLKLLDLIV